jgi:hypothetical protein
MDTQFEILGKGKHRRMNIRNRKRIARTDEQLRDHLEESLIRNVLTRRREYGTYLATAHRHRKFVIERHFHFIEVMCRHAT